MSAMGDFLRSTRAAAKSGRKHPMDFESWLKMVDDACWAYAGLSKDDLPDVCYRDWYDAGTSPQAAARKAIRNARK